MTRHHIDKQVSALDSDRYIKSFTTWNQLTALLYAQASGKQSLRDIQNGIAAQGAKLCRIGLPDGVKRSILSDANKNRPSTVFERLFYSIIDRCKDITPKHKFRFKNPFYAIDATHHRPLPFGLPLGPLPRRQGAIKLHCQLAFSGCLPVFVAATDGKCHDLTVANSLFKVVPESCDSLLFFISSDY